MRRFPWSLPIPSVVQFVTALLVILAVTMTALTNVLPAPEYSLYLWLSLAGTQAATVACTFPRRQFITLKVATVVATVLLIGKHCFWTGANSFFTGCLVTLNGILLIFGKPGEETNHETSKSPIWKYAEKVNDDTDNEPHASRRSVAPSSVRRSSPHPYRIKNSGGGAAVDNAADDGAFGSERDRSPLSDCKFRTVRIADRLARRRSVSRLVSEDVGGSASIEIPKDRSPRNEQPAEDVANDRSCSSEAATNEIAKVLPCSESVTKRIAIDRASVCQKVSIKKAEDHLPVNERDYEPSLGNDNETKELTNDQSSNENATKEIANDRASVSQTASMKAEDRLPGNEQVTKEIDINLPSESEKPLMEVVKNASVDREQASNISEEASYGAEGVTVVMSDCRSIGTEQATKILNDCSPKAKKDIEQIVKEQAENANSNYHRCTGDISNDRSAGSEKVTNETGTVNSQPSHLSHGSTEQAAKEMGRERRDHAAKVRRHRTRSETVRERSPLSDASPEDTDSDRCHHRCKCRKGGRVLSRRRGRCDCREEGMEELIGKVRERCREEGSPLMRNLATYLETGSFPGSQGSLTQEERVTKASATAPTEVQQPSVAVDMRRVLEIQQALLAIQGQSHQQPQQAFPSYNLPVQSHAQRPELQQAQPTIFPRDLAMRQPEHQQVHQTYPQYSMAMHGQTQAPLPLHQQVYSPQQAHHMLQRNDFAVGQHERRRTLSHLAMQNQLHQPAPRQPGYPNFPIQAPQTLYQPGLRQADFATHAHAQSVPMHQSEQRQRNYPDFAVPAQNQSTPLQQQELRQHSYPDFAIPAQNQSTPLQQQQEHRQRNYHDVAAMQAQTPTRQPGAQQCYEDGRTSVALQTQTLSPSSSAEASEGRCSSPVEDVGRTRRRTRSMTMLATKEGRQSPSDGENCDFLPVRPTSRKSDRRKSFSDTETGKTSRRGRSAARDKKQRPTLLDEGGDEDRRKTKVTFCPEPRVMLTNVAAEIASTNQAEEASSKKKSREERRAAAAESRPRRRANKPERLDW